MADTEFFNSELGEAVGDGLASSIGSVASSLSGINQYDVQETGLPFQYEESMTSRRNRERMQARVDKLNDKWNAQQEHRRKVIEDQKERVHNFRMQAEEQNNANMDLTNRFSAAMRMISNENKNNAKVQEASQRILDVADQDNELKDQMITNWGS